MTSPSRTLVAPGLRTAAHPSWSSEVGTALAVIATQPHLWLTGAAGFALRGGIVLLLLPILVLPTQVEVRLLLGDNLGSSGLTPTFWALVAGASAVSALIALGVVLALTRIEVSGFRRLVADPESAELRAWRDASQPTRGAMTGLYGRVFLVQALGLLALCLFVLPLATGVGPATLDEILRPSSSAAIYERVLVQLTPQIALFVFGIVLVEAVTALATRRLLLGSFGLSGWPRSRRPLAAALAFALTCPIRSPLRTIRTATLGWLMTLLALVPSLWAISVAWQQTRAAFLTSTSVGDLVTHPGPLFVSVLLSAVFIGGLLLTGFASAFRQALWSLDSLAQASSEPSQEG